MKVFKKILALALTVIIGVSVFAVSAAAVTAPEFTMSVVSQTDSTVTVEISITGGKFCSVDMEFTTGKYISKCNSIKTTQSFRNLSNDYTDDGSAVVSVANAATNKCAIASVKAIEAKNTLFTAVFTKTKSADITSSDLSLKINSCSIYDNGNVDLTSSVVVKQVYNSFAFNNETVSMNYKKTVALSYTSKYDAKDIKWSSSNNSIVKVDDNGNVTSLKTGSAVITAKNANGDVLGKCTVNVSYSFLQLIIVYVLFGWIWY